LGLKEPKDINIRNKKGAILAAVIYEEDEVRFLLLS
jgi:hypothetical protein